MFTNEEWDIDESWKYHTTCFGEMTIFNSVNVYLGENIKWHAASAVEGNGGFSTLLSRRIYSACAQQRNLFCCVTEGFMSGR